MRSISIWSKVNGGCSIKIEKEQLRYSSMKVAKGQNENYSMGKDKIPNSHKDILEVEV